jgi:hypothetical protein
MSRGKHAIGKANTETLAAKKSQCKYTLLVLTFYTDVKAKE